MGDVSPASPAFFRTPSNPTPVAQSMKGRPFDTPRSSVGRARADSASRSGIPPSTPQSRVTMPDSVRNARSVFENGLNGGTLSHANAGLVLEYSPTAANA